MKHRFKDEWLVPVAREALGVPTQFIESARVAASNQFLAAALIRAGLVTPDALGTCVRKRYGCGFAAPTPAEVDRELLTTVPERICRQYGVLPLRATGTHVEVATANPLDLQAEQEIRFATGRKPVFLYCPPDHLNDLLARVLNPDEIVYDLLKKIEVSQVVELMASAEGDDEVDAVHAPVVRLVNAIIAKAIELRASDIHLEHEERASQVRYRVDGVLRTSLIVPRYLAAGPLASRLKIMAKLDVAERRRPQDGQAKIRVGGAPITLRVSTLPTQFGEKVVARVLDARQARLSLGDLGFSPEIAARFKRHLDADQGFLLVTGPTGSGKTSTLYAAVSALTDAATNIVSIEDPIEYHLEGINQVQINERQGLTFASVLRSVLRQDPDVILVGEIRDRETADTACQAAMTGHVVLSTLHTNDSTTAVTRLADIGVDRYKILTSLRAVTAQRLVRRLCGCREPLAADQLPPQISEGLRRYGLPQVGYAPRGCGACQFTGFAQRVLIAELLEVTATLAEKIAATTTAAELRARATELGVLEPLEKDALWHFTQGHLAADDALLYVEAQEGMAMGSQDREVPASSHGSPSRGGVRVLVIDDNSGRRERLCGILSGAGYRPETVESTPAAVAKIATQPPDAVLTVLRLPMMSGVDFTRYVRAQAGFAALPIIAMYDDEDGDLRRDALAAGASELLDVRHLDILAVPLLQAVLARAGDFSPGRDIMTPRLPANEGERLASLRRWNLMDSGAEERFDSITRLAARTFDTPIALVTVLDRERQWFKSKVGLTSDETPREEAFCAHAIHEDDVMVIPDARLDPRFCDNPSVDGDPHIRFYAGCPIATPEGYKVGTLCVIDRVPRQFTDADRQTLTDLAKLVEREIAGSAIGA